MTAQKQAADDLVTKLQSQVSSSTSTFGGSTGGSIGSSGSFGTSGSTGSTGSFGSSGSTAYGVNLNGGSTGGISRVVLTGGSLSSGSSASSLSSAINSALQTILNPTPVGSFSSYIQRLYSLKPEDYKGYISVPSTYQTMYGVNKITWDALTGQSLAGTYFQKNKPLVSGISRSQIGSSSANALGNFGCSTSGSSSGISSGYGKVTSVQPGYLLVQGNNGNTVNLRVGSCSRIESNRPEYIVSVGDKVFYKGKPSNKSEI